MGRLAAGRRIGCRCVGAGVLENYVTAGHRRLFGDLTFVRPYFLDNRSGIDRFLQ